MSHALIRSALESGQGSAWIVIMSPDPKLLSSTPPIETLTLSSEYE
jgi:hypothetical protein